MFLRPSAFDLDLSGPPIDDDKENIKRLLYKELVQLTGRESAWGILTGVKPLKLFAMLATGATVSECAARAKRILREDYYVSLEKLALLEAAWRVQHAALPKPKAGSVSIYVGIPFCPSRCAYCSFTSEPYDETAARNYLDALRREIDFVSKRMRDLGIWAESIYVGGGTPTALKASELRELLRTLSASVPTGAGFEYTVEAGRPDTLTDEMCGVLRDCGVDRISINPQSMHAETLSRIGRRHDGAMISRAFETARRAGIRIVNSDIIAGLPGESAEDFRGTLDAVLSLKPENVTVHTLSIKKGSNLREADEELCYNIEGSAASMLTGLPERLHDCGFRPYYLYRQKQAVDNLENVGYALPGTECLYNMRIMEEKQTVIAMGAAGSSKVYFPSEDRIERVFNVSDRALYVERIDEMLMRKENRLFGVLPV
jgi:oxygen-independent coproporphyrinogen-3 oxidase